MLMNEETKYIALTGERILSSMTLINYAEKYLKQKRDLLKDIQYEVNLFTENAFNIYKKNVSYDFQFTYTICQSSYKWLAMLKNGEYKDGSKIDKRKKYEEKERFEFLLQSMRKIFGRDDLIINEILDYNYNKGWEIGFSLSNKQFRLLVPIMQHIEIKDYESMGDYVFKLNLSVMKKKSCWTNIGSTFKEDELKDILNKYLEEENK